MTQCLVETIDDIERFAALKDEWNALLKDSASNCLFLTWEWLFTWWKHLAEDRRLHIITMRYDGKLVAIVPLARRGPRMKQLLPYSALEFVGMGDVGSDYLDIIVRRGREHYAWEVLAKYMAEREQVLELSRVNGSSGQAVGLASALQEHGWIALGSATDTCPVIDLSGHTWESYLADLGSEHRYNFRRRLKNLGKRWRMSIEKVQTEEQRSQCLPLLVRLHRLCWQERGGSGALHTAELVRFHEEFSKIALARGWLRLYVLRLDGDAAAAWYGFHYGGIFYFYQSGFDPRFSKHSVGLVVTGLAIKSAIEEGAKVYDFLLGDERYKFLCAREERELVRLGAYPPSLRGALYRQYVELRWSIKKRVWHYLPSAS
jgi:CelD/BcsL family acetyltransferase involved in cellulose biosynthesis